jgi:diguanylate cyclase (GGDEF)-like protein/PAS domain S-box-containing protein
MENEHRIEPDLQVVVDAIPVPIFFKDVAGTYRGCNRAFEAYIGLPRDRIIGKTVHDVAPPDLADVYAKADRALFAAGGVQTYETQVRYADGTRHHVVFNKATFPRPDGGLGGLVGTILDVTERKRAERALRQSEERYRAVVGSLAEGILLVAADGRVLMANPAAERILGLSAAELLDGAEWTAVRDDGAPMPAEETPLRAALATGRAHDGVELGIDRRDGTRAWVSMSARPLRQLVDGHAFAVVLSMADVSDRRHAQARLQHETLHDALTGLPNRALFMDRLERALVSAQRRSEHVAVASIDLDRFKVVNDALGHRGGDRLLQEVATRLAGALRTSDTMARMGGDEFCAILPGLADRAEAVLAANRMLAAMRAAFEVHGRDVHASVSIGLALYPDDGEDPHTLLRGADSAMYHAKEGGKNQVRIFARGKHDDSRLDFETRLHRAIDRQELTLHYQPIVDVSTARVLGVEALLRWHDPGLGDVTPDRIIPVAEETGLIIPIGAWALHEACRQAMAWQREGMPLRVSVNVSAVQLRGDDFIEVVADALRETGLAPHWLELELTESAIMRDEAAETLRALRGLGVYLAVDDFGIGYSSLSQLQRLPVTALKIDRSFVADVAKGPGLVEPIIRLAHGLGLRVIAEGVESHDQLKALRMLGCDQAQGFALGAPVPAEGMTGAKVARGIVSSA